MSTPKSLPVLFEDDDFIAVNKPPRLLVHKTELSTDRTAALQIVRNQLGHHVYPVHRLDRATSGILLFGKNPEAHKFAAAQFESRQVQKSYLAIIRGWPTESTGLIDSALKKENGEEQDAITAYEVLFKVDYPYAVTKFPTSRYSMLRAYPKTGRMHQIRRHLRRLSGPLIGDSNYGEGKHNRFFKEVLKVKHLLLFAESLVFYDKNDQKISVTCPLPDYFTKIMEDFSWPEEQLSAVDYPSFS
jgi:tRNA pseudouridine65 synthase